MNKRKLITISILITLGIILQILPQKTYTPLYYELTLRFILFFCPFLLLGSINILLPITEWLNYEKRK